MKNILFLLSGVLMTQIALSQAPDSSRLTYLSHYVFPAFVKGTVQQKRGAAQEAMLNYNSMTQEIVFVQNGSYLALGQPENIDTVHLENRKFIPHETQFYEVVTLGTMPLYINHRCKVIPPGNPAGYGTSSQTSSPGNISTIANNAMSYALKLPDDYKIIPETEFLLKKGEEFSKISNAKQLTKLFPAKADAIQDFIKKNKTSFKSQEDMIKLVQFCNQAS